MKKFFLDTNFVMDLLIRDEFKPISKQFLTEGVQNNHQLFISYLSVANFAYIIRKQPSENIYKYINTVLNLFHVVHNTEHQIRRAIELQVPDFEDGLQYQAAIDAECDIIITRNSKDFPFAKIPVMSAEEYLRS